MRQKNIAFLLFFCISICFQVNAQITYLAPEIERLERLAENPGQRRDSLYQLARLHQLSGNREKALETWNLAVRAVSGSRDDTAYLEAIKLLISMGEYERAAAELTTLISSSRDESILQSARYLSAQLEVFGNGSPDALTALAENPGYANLRSRIYYTLWKLTDDSSWRTRLVDSFPRSPEAAIAADSSKIIAAITPQWLFLPSRDSSNITVSVVPPPPVTPSTANVNSANSGSVSASSPSTNSANSSSANTSSPSTSSASSGSANTSSSSMSSANSSSASREETPSASNLPSDNLSESSIMLQTGLFSREDNARAQAARLTSAGFRPVVSTRKINNIDYWVVNVPSGENVNRSIAELKDAGFEAFPVN